MKNRIKIATTLLACATVLTATGCNKETAPIETQKPINVANESLAYETTDTPETTVAETTATAEVTTKKETSVSSIDNYVFDLDEAFDTNMENNISDNVKFSLKITALKEATLETVQDAWVNGFNENNSNSVIVPFDGYMTYGDLCNIKGCELEPWNFCQKFDADGTPIYQYKENLAMYHPTVNNVQDVYTENGREQGTRTFEFCGILHDSITEKPIENENLITSQSSASTLIECVSGGEVITDKNATIPADAIIKGIAGRTSPYSDVTILMTLESGDTIELAGERIVDNANVKKYFRELGLITTTEDDEIYRYEMRDDDNARKLVFKNNNAVLVFEFAWNGGGLENIILIKR